MLLLQNGPTTGLNIGDKDIMRERITEPEWAYFWAIYMYR